MKFAQRGVKRTEAISSAFQEQSCVRVCLVCLRKVTENQRGGKVLPSTVTCDPRAIVTGGSALKDGMPEPFSGSQAQWRLEDQKKAKILECLNGRRIHV